MMASTIGKGLLRRLFRPQHDYLPGTTIFREIDIELLSREFELAAKGAADGAQNIPSEKARVPSVTEQGIARQITHYWTEARDGARRAYEGMLGRSASLSAETEIDTLIGLPDAVRASVFQFAREGRDALAEAHARFAAAEASLARFLEREGIEHPPHQPKPIALRVLVLVLACALELVVNTSIFAKGDEFGFAGALLKVLLIPVLNVGATFALVFFGARHILRGGPARLIGVLGIVLTAGWIVYFNLGIAHWRDSLSASVSMEAGRVAFTRAFTASLELASDESWMLFAAGCAAAVVAALDAWFWEDPHPGYSARVAARDRARATFNNQRAQAVGNIDYVADAALSGLKDEQRKAETATGRRPELAAQADALREDLKAYREHLVDIAGELSGRYREANLRARTAPPPAYFDADLPLDLPLPSLPSLARTSPSRDVAGLLAKAISDISRSAEEAKAQLPTLSELKAAKC